MATETPLYPSGFQKNTEILDIDTGRIFISPLPTPLDPNFGKL